MGWQAAAAAGAPAVGHERCEPDIQVGTAHLAQVFFCLSLASGRLQHNRMAGCNLLATRLLLDINDDSLSFRCLTQETVGMWGSCQLCCAE